MFLTAACRAVGIPARVAGVPHWDKGSETCPDGDADAACGNHNWVEVWVDGEWAFVDQDGNKELNTGWFYPGDTGFQQPGTTNHSIFSSSWAPPSTLPAELYPNSSPSVAEDEHYPMVWDWGYTGVPAWDVTLRYHD